MVTKPAKTLPPSEAQAADPDARGTVTYSATDLEQVGSNRYKTLRFLARGGMGEVWLAEDRDLRREVALKRLKKKGVDQHDRFLAEAQITGQLEHPAIVPVHDLGIDQDGEIFYVMKLVQGRTLEDEIDEYHGASSSSYAERTVQWRSLLENFVHLCEAIAYAHNRGVIHRDIKPDNVMVGAYGETLVLDWGLAKVLAQPELPGLPSGDGTARGFWQRSPDSGRGESIYEKLRHLPWNRGELGRCLAGFASFGNDCRCGGLAQRNPRRYPEGQGHGFFRRSPE